MNSRSQIHINLTGLAFLSFVFAIVYMVGHVREMIDIISSYVQYNQRSYLNLSNMAYCLVGVVHSMIAVSIMYPHKNIMAKKDMLKGTCYLMSILYLLANVWIFQWIFQCFITRSWSFDVAQFLKVENMMFNHMQWVSRNGETIFYNHLSAVIWFLLGYYFDRDRKITCKLMLAQMAMTFLVPLVVYALLYSKIAPDWWIKKTIPLLCSDIILVFAMFYIARNRETWIKYVCPLRKTKRKRRHHHHHHSHDTETTETVEVAENIESSDVTELSEHEVAEASEQNEIAQASEEDETAEISEPTEDAEETTNE